MARRSGTRSCRWRCCSPRSPSWTRPTPDWTSTRSGPSARASTGFVRPVSARLLITHYTRILRYIKPDFVHVFFDGRIVESGGAELADKLEANGYAGYGVNEPAAVWARPEIPPRQPLLNRRGGSADVIRRRTRSGRISRSCSREVHGVPLVYLDSANTSQKPQVVLDTLDEYYRRHNANVARAVHTLGSEATSLFEGARDKVAAFINAPSRDEVIFTKNISESLNLLAYSLSNATTLPRRGTVPNRPGRQRRGHRDGAPLQSGAVAVAGAAHRGGVPLHPDRRGRPAGRRGHRRADRRAHQGGVLRPPVQRPRHGQPGVAAGGPGEIGRRADHPRRRSVGTAPSAGRTRAGRRLRRLHRPQAVRSDRGRRALGPLRLVGRICRRSWAVAR